MVDTTGMSPEQIQALKLKDANAGFSQGLLSAFGGPSPDKQNEMIDARAASAQASREANTANGLSSQNMEINQGGVGGAFGGTKDFPIYTASNYQDPNYASNRSSLANGLGNVLSRPTLSMQAANSGPAAQLDPMQQIQFRNQQLGLAHSLSDQANGNGPSVAGSQLQQSTEQNLQAAMAQAASSRGGNLGAAQYQLGYARANIQQQAAQGLAQTRIQEQMSARQQLGDVLNSSRGSDIGIAAQNAQLGQANNQYNAGLQQGANATNLGAAVDQQAQRDAMVQYYRSQGLGLDQANSLAQINQRQFNVGQMNQGTAAGNGLSTQNSAQGLQVLGGAAQAAGSFVAGTATGGASYGAQAAAALGKK